MLVHRPVDPSGVDVTQDADSRMMLPQSTRAGRFAASSAVVFLVISVATARAAELVIEPLEPSVGHCNEIVLEIRLTGRDAETRLSGYQLFLDFTTSQVVPLRFEAETLSSTVYTAGPAPLGTGFAGCPAWSDGQGQDMVAIGATIFPDSDGAVVEEIPVGEDIVLGRLVFEQVAAVFGSVQLFFFLNDESCRDLFDESTAVFDENGQAIELTLPAFGTVTVVDATGPVEDLSCGFDGPDAVTLTWQNPLGSSFNAILVLRDGEQIDQIGGDAETYRDDSLGGVSAPSYTILPLVDLGTVTGCAATCRVASAGEPFRRGDVNFDGNFNITDGVLILRSVVSGEIITCRDAADVDDDGIVGITDAIYGLNFLFQSGPAVPPPFGELGLDPTDDQLGCEV
jgi:hypothetical protein